MEKFTTINSIAAPMPLVNIDTDMIIPKQFLKTIKRTGLGINLFHEMRYDLQGKEIGDFILNKKPYRAAEIIIAGDNFGCGSSREHAPWALFDFGIKCIIAPSFADIFYNNCFKNGILPIILPQNQIDELTNLSKKEGIIFVVNLQTQKITVNNKIYQFNVDDFRKTCLINGLDDIALTLQKENKINQFESKNRQSLSWLY